MSVEDDLRSRARFRIVRTRCFIVSVKWREGSRQCGGLGAQLAASEAQALPSGSSKTN